LTVDPEDKRVGIRRTDRQAGIRKTDRQTDRQAGQDRQAGRREQVGRFRSVSGNGDSTPDRGE